MWVGAKAGTAVAGFITGALTKATGDHPDVSGWYASFLQNVALPNAVVFSYLVTFGEILVGVALILGQLTGIAAFFGGFMNASYLFAGTVSTNPVLLLAGLDRSGLAGRGLLGARPLGVAAARRSDCAQTYATEQICAG